MVGPRLSREHQPEILAAIFDRVGDHLPDDKGTAFGISRNRQVKPHQLHPAAGLDDRLRIAFERRADQRLHRRALDLEILLRRFAACVVEYELDKVVNAAQ